MTPKTDPKTETLVCRALGAQCASAVRDSETSRDPGTRSVNDTTPDGIPIAALSEWLARDTLVDWEEAHDHEDDFPTEAA